MKVAVAQILRPRGLKGELAVKPYQPGTQSLRDGLPVTLQKDAIARDFTIEFVKFLRDRISLKLTGIEDEESASFWKGGDLLVEKDQLAALGEGEYYHFQLEGCEVYEEEGKMIGIVAGIDFLAAHDVLTVKTDDGEVLIPLTRGFIVSVDTEQKKIVIRKIEGLY